MSDSDKERDDPVEREVRERFRHCTMDHPAIALLFRECLRRKREEDRNVR